MFLLKYRSGKSEDVFTTQAPRTGAQPSHAVLPLESPDSTAVTKDFDRLSRLMAELPRDILNERLSHKEVRLVRHEFAKLLKAA